MNIGDVKRIKEKIIQTGLEVNKNCNEHDYGVLLTCIKLLKYIESLPEEICSYYIDDVTTLKK